MEIEIDELKETHAELRIRGATPSQVNAIRRALLADVPKMAIEDVEFHLGSIRDESTGKDYDSSTSIFDESIALRLGLLPIPTDLKQFRFRESCSCRGEGCPHCQILYSIDKKGPVTVYSKDVVPLGDPSLAIKDPNIPIVRLGVGQALLAYATAVLGTAKTHAKWQVAQAAGYRYQPHVSVNPTKDCTSACLKRAADACPTHVFDFSDGQLKVRDEDRCILCQACVEACPHGGIRVEASDKDFLFRFETDGSLTARETLRYALGDLKRRLEDLREAVLGLP
jgi:DNA-directed RNA polymerase subunit D